ncbi:MAG: magnesium/cobalt transporter CorA [Candidatus Staskawiczbacteria bacterium]
MSNLQNNNSTKSNVYLFDYDSNNLEEKRALHINECIPYKETKTVTWINIDQVPPISFLSDLQLGFDLHPVVVEDILNINQRPKVEEMPNYIFLALKMFSFNKNTNKVIPEQTSIILAKNFLITFQQGIRGDNFESIRNSLRKNDPRIRSLGTDYLCYELINSVVFNYFNVLEDFSNYIEKLEKEMIQKPTSETLNKIYHFKRQILELRKSIWPLRETIHILERSESKLIKDYTRIYFRDIYERLIQIIDVIETYRDITSGMLDVYLSSISNKTNSVMKILTIITTIFMPISFLAGFFGMNFQYLPWLESPLAPLFLTIVMVTIFLAMLLFFKIKKLF